MTSPIPGLEQVPLIGILRRCPPEHARAVAEAAVAAGLRVIEVTMDSDRALDQIRLLTGLGSGLTVGVGSVLDAATAAAAIDAGARFVVTPVVDEPTITACVDRRVPIVPGASTPTEIRRALLLGATAVKVFPAHQLGGPAYLRAIAAPLGHPPLVPTGGIEAEHVTGYLEAGAVAVGAGGGLFPRSALEAADAGEIGRRARAWVAGTR